SFPCSFDVALGEMFSIKPPFLAPETAGVPLNYGQIKEKESSRKKARGAQSKGDSQGRRQKIDIEKSRANYKKGAKTSGEASAKIFQIQKSKQRLARHAQAARPESSREETRLLHPRAKGA